MHVHSSRCNDLNFLSFFPVTSVNLDKLKSSTDVQQHHAEVHIIGDPDLDKELTLTVATSQFTRNFHLRRVKTSVLHDDFTSFTVVAVDIPVRFEAAQADTQEKSRQFFYDENSGVVVSIVRNVQDNSLHVNGFLDYETRISSPEVPTAHSADNRKRDTGRQESDNRHAHTVWERDATLSHPGIRSRHLEDSTDDIEDDERLEYTNDYIEVPPMFKNKTLWRKAAPPHGPRTTKVASNNNNHDSNIGTRDDARAELRLRGTRRGRRKRQEVGDTQTAPPQSLIPGGTSGSGITSVARGASNGTYVVEVMVMVDVKMCEAFNYDSRQLEDYILHFWQAVNLRLQAIVEPRIQLKIRSYGKFLFSGFQTFIESSRIPGSRERVSLDDVLEGFRAWIQTYESNTMNPPHDVAVLMTGETLCKKTDNGSCVDSAKGIGYKGGACITARRFTGHSYDVGVIEVNRIYSAVLTAAHELGHLLGASHDGEGDATSCSKMSSYIMSYSWTDAYRFNRFSSCSKLSISNFLNQVWYSDCLRWRWQWLSVSKSTAGSTTVP
ncbi:uncharacterized protein LOC112573337 [Pomacea canaliculata]|uniref:uncharacterized protein LOC112573337 n=1 Tax=Pomacea canaliculata TaxID=400727 RepID=UPI000D73D79B|nr:uncharacterized protein LOC112573337 [Pomacea canaliculata]